MRRKRYNDTERFDYAISYLALHDSMLECAKGVRWKNSVSAFVHDSIQQLTSLRRLINRGHYRMMDPINFTIYEPKERHIQSIHFKDRVFQKSLCTNVVTPIIASSFIYDNGASTKGKGYSFSLDRLSHHLHSYYINHGTEGYVLKCDISKYFDSIDHSILYDILCTYFFDDRVLFYLKDSIHKYGINDVGIGLGSEINQLMALLYLNDMDHFIKEQLGIKYYGRYMDDFYLIHRDKEYLKYCKNKIEDYVLTNRHLTLSEKKTQIFPITNGFTFIGFRHVLTDSGKVVLKLTQQSIQKMKKKLKSFHGLYLMNRIGLLEIHESYQSWRAHAMIGNSYKIVSMMDDLFYKLFEIPFDEVIA